MSLPEPATIGHAAAQRASVALERGEMESAIKQLAGGVAWTADMLVALEQRVIALEDQPGDLKKQPRFDLSDYRIQQL